MFVLEECQMSAEDIPVVRAQVCGNCQQPIGLRPDWAEGHLLLFPCGKVEVWHEACCDYEREKIPVGTLSTGFGIGREGWWCEPWVQSVDWAVERAECDALQAAFDAEHPPSLF